MYTEWGGGVVVLVVKVDEIARDNSGNKVYSVCLK